MAEPIIRIATEADVPAIVRLLADDILGAKREGDPADPRYLAAFRAVERSPDSDLFVIEEDGAVVACAQLTLTPGITSLGRTRATLESVHVAASRRGGGLGAFFVQRLADIARGRGAGLLQLSSSKVRVDAHRFYERLGFARSHEGFKLELQP